MIRELIELIRKVGGLDRLEEQLQQRLTLTENSAVLSVKPNETLTTVYPITSSFYDKIFNGKNLTAQKPLSRQNKETKYSSVIRNSRVGPQNEGIESDVIIKERPQYVTLTRVSQKPRPDPEKEDVDESDNVDNDFGEEAENIDVENKPPTTQSPQYVVIRRNRPSTTEETTIDSDKDVIINETPIRSTNQYISINRNRPTKPQDIVEKAEITNAPENK